MFNSSTYRVTDPRAGMVKKNVRDWLWHPVRIVTSYISDIVLPFAHLCYYLKFLKIIQNNENNSV